MGFFFFEQFFYKLKFPPNLLEEKKKAHLSAYLFFYIFYLKILFYFHLQKLPTNRSLFLKSLLLFFLFLTYSRVPGILPIFISPLILFLSPIFLRVFFFLTYSESFLVLYLLLLRRDKMPEPCTLLVNFLISPKLLSFPLFATSTFVAMPRYYHKFKMMQ